MTDVNQNEREFGLAGHPDGDLSGGEVVPKAQVVFDQDDYEGGEGADLDEEAE